jgi:hypothetical protein
LAQLKTDSLLRRHIFLSSSTDNQFSFTSPSVPCTDSPTYYPQHQQPWTLFYTLSQHLLALRLIWAISSVASTTWPGQSLSLSICLYMLCSVSFCINLAESQSTRASPWPAWLQLLTLPPYSQVCSCIVRFSIRYEGSKDPLPRDCRISTTSRTWESWTITNSLTGFTSSMEIS